MAHTDHVVRDRNGKEIARHPSKGRAWTMAQAAEPDRAKRAEFTVDTETATDWWDK